MKIFIFTLTLTFLVFSFGVIADETIKPDGWWWQKISPIRQLGYVEGFVAGQAESSEEAHCKTVPAPATEAYWQSTASCILSRFRGNTLVGTDTNKTLDVMVRFYASPQNLPVSWGHAVIISQAMVSGVSVSEKDLEVIRKEDATPPQAMTPAEEQQLRDFVKKNPPKE
jgi:hypothetical protein